VWCADRAALLLMIRIDKLKTREKYERHFLLLSLVFTLMVRVRKWCDDTFGSFTEPTKLSTFARPKAGRFCSTCSVFFVSVSWIP
jgi:endoribonuclease Dicer